MKVEVKLSPNCMLESTCLFGFESQMNYLVEKRVKQVDKLIFF